MVNPASILKLKSAWDRFTQNHPKFPAFMNAAGQGMIEDGSIIEISIEHPDGRKINTNVKVCSSDLELFEEIKNMR